MTQYKPIRTSMAALPGACTIKLLTVVIVAVS